jgi:hypothetical protein
MWLSQLHDAIQLAFDWYDYQTHTFTLGSRRFGNPVAGEENSVEDDRDVMLSDLGLEEGGRLAYRYNFGEGWEVEVMVEAAGPVEKRGPVRQGNARGRRRIAADWRRSMTCFPAWRIPPPSSDASGVNGSGPITNRTLVTPRRSPRLCDA